MENFLINIILLTVQVYIYKDLTLETNINKKKEKREFTIKLYDSVAHERFQEMTKSIYNGVDGILLLYDITNRESFDSIEMWIKKYMSIAEKLKDILLY